MMLERIYKETLQSICKQLMLGVTPQTDTFEPLDEKKDLQFKEKYDNPWNEYTLDNDYILMLKPIITQVNRTGKCDLRGIPLYIIQSQVAAKVKP